MHRFVLSVGIAALAVVSTPLAALAQTPTTAPAAAKKKPPVVLRSASGTVIQPTRRSSTIQTAPRQSSSSRAVPTWTPGRKCRWVIRVRTTTHFRRVAIRAGLIGISDPTQRASAARRSRNHG